MSDHIHPEARTNTLLAQRARVFRVATQGAGVLIHFVVCWAALTAGYLELDSFEFLGLGSLAAAGFLFLTILIAFEWNLSLEDPDLALPQMLWSITVVLMTTHFVTELRPAVLFSGVALVLLGSYRLNPREQVVLAVYSLSLYLLSLYYLSQTTELAWIPEAITAAAFALVLIFGPLLSRVEAGFMETALVDKNEELSHALERIQELAVKDELTGAFNRRHVMEVLMHEKALADRGGYGFTLCYIDLDFFKRVNDRFGHAAGDDVLRNFVDIARAIMREVDCVARLGGEEFLLVLSGATQEAALVVSRRLAEGLKGMSVSTIEPGYRITASVGITEYRSGEEIRTTLERADKALYDAKRTGRNKFVIADMPERLSLG